MRLVLRPGDAFEAARLHEKLTYFESENGLLGGLTDRSREVFVAQLIESQRRVRYLHLVRDACNNGISFEPQSKSFDPLKGAVLSNCAGDYDEACWLVFLSVHFGRHLIHKWALSGSFYGRLGQGGRWQWVQVSEDPEAVLDWLDENEAALRTLGIGFGNHRKYQSLKARGPRGTGAAIRTYVDWVGSSHAQRFADVASNAELPTERFALLYDSLSAVAEFGRTARFDYLATLGRLALADVEADSLHLAGSTGPQNGARLLVLGTRISKIGPSELEIMLAPLRESLEVSFDVLEDALCNWQKSPNFFVPFRG